MHCPAAFSETRPPALFALMRAHPLATLVTAGSGGLIANLIPFQLIESGDTGCLRAHMARSNAQLQDLRAETEALVIFHGPEHYITPSWYPSKAEHGKVVPTWNYAVVQVRGRATVVDDADWLLAHVSALTAQQEAGRPAPWRVDDAPADHVAALLRGITGLEIAIEQIEGKWKLGQNRNERDRQGVFDGLRREDGAALAHLMDASRST